MHANNLDDTSHPHFVKKKGLAAKLVELQKWRFSRESQEPIVESNSYSSIQGLSNGTGEADHHSPSRKSKSYTENQSILGTGANTIATDKSTCNIHEKFRDFTDVVNTSERNFGYDDAGRQMSCDQTAFCTGQDQNLKSHNHLPDMLYINEISTKYNWPYSNSIESECHPHEHKTVISHYNSRTQIVPGGAVHSKPPVASGGAIHSKPPDASARSLSKDCIALNNLHLADLNGHENVDFLSQSVEDFTDRNKSHVYAEIIHDEQLDQEFNTSPSSIVSSNNGFPSSIFHNKIVNNNKSLPPIPSNVAEGTDIHTTTKFSANTYHKERFNRSFTRDLLFERIDLSTTDVNTVDSVSVISSQGLPIILTEQVKNRSSNLGDSGSSNEFLLGSVELDRYLPDRKLNIYIGSWNMCEIKVCTVSMDEFILPLSTKVLLDMYIIGTQENAMNKKEWEVLLQDTLGVSHVLLYSASHGALHICLFIRRDLMWFCSGLEWDSVMTRLVTAVKTKGAVAVSMNFFGTTLLFVNSHFTCDNGKTKKRMADYEKIIKELKLPKLASTEESILSRYDCIFWCGDLNFRIDKGRTNVDNILGHLSEQDAPNYEHLIAGDQLYKCITEDKIFQDFREGRITFSPTYKFDLDSDTYDTSSKMRIPSYTDRVLYRSRIKSMVTCVCYDAVPSIKVSDHRPVYAVYQVTISPAVSGFQSDVHLKFDKSVYIEASKRRRNQLGRAKNTGDQKSSSVCSVM